MKTVILTGATGFVGRQIHRALVADGCRVHAIIRTGSRARLDFPTGQITETDDLFALSVKDWQNRLGTADMFIHAAWYVNPADYLDSPRNLDCALGSLTLFEACQLAGIRHFVGLGTCMEYAPSDRPLDIASACGPNTLYAASKLALYRMMQKRSETGDMHFSWCRLFYLYGEKEYPQRLVPMLHRQLRQGLPVALGSGLQVRDFLDVADAGRMIADIALMQQLGIINICSGQPVTVRAMAEKIADQYGRRDLLSFGTAALHPRDPASVVGICNAVAPQRIPDRHQERA